MSSNRFTKLLLLALSTIFLSVASPENSIQAQIIQLDFSGINIVGEGEEEGANGLSLINALRYVEAVEQGKAFWDARILGYSNKLPRDVQSQLLGSLTILVGNDALGDPDAVDVLGEAGLVNMSFINIVRGTTFDLRPVAVGQVAVFTLDNDFIINNPTSELVDVAIHEFAHALGLGTLWGANGLDSTGSIGPLQYTGENARAAFAIESGVAGLAQTGFVPIEQQGGPGTALSHWDDNDPFFNSIALNNRIELMTGFLVPNTERFVSRTTLAQFVDLNYAVKGFNEDELIQFPGLGEPSLGIPSFGRSGPIPGPLPIPGSTLPIPDDGAATGGTNQPRRTLNIYKRRRR